MPLKIQTVDVWATQLLDHPGDLGRVLTALANAIFPRRSKSITTRFAGGMEKVWLTPSWEKTMNRVTLTASFALATVAPVYAQHVNNHVMLLGVVAALTSSLQNRA